MPMGSRLSITLVTSLILLAGVVFAQSTGSIQGTVTDMTGAVLPNASVTVTNQQTGESHPLKTDSAGLYSVPGLTPGNYKVEVQTRGMQTPVANDLVVSVGITTTQNFTLKIAGTSTTVEIQATAAILESASVSVGTVVNQKTVQEIPLNGRHFVDLALLIPGSVTPPANGFLTAPLRGQGSFSFNSAGAREDSVNFMINGINLNDPNQNQITFQPTINTVGEFIVDNQNLVYGCQGLTACPRKNLELIAETRLTGKSFGYRETPFAFLDDFNTALEAIRQGWYERAFQRGLDGLLPMQNPPQKKAKGAVSAEFFN